MHLGAIERAQQSAGGEKIAKKALERKSGARGLRAIIEDSILDIMYDVPSMEGVKEVVINEEVVVSGARPMIVYDNEAASA